MSKRTTKLDYIYSTVYKGPIIIKDKGFNTRYDDPFISKNELLLRLYSDKLDRSLITKKTVNTVGTINVGPQYPHKFGNGSSYHDENASNYLQLANQNDTNLGNVFTIETWARLGAVPSVYPTAYSDPTQKRCSLFGQDGLGGSTDNNLAVSYYGQIYFSRAVNTGATISLYSYDGIITVGKWFHVALVSTGTEWLMFVDGILQDSVTSSASWYTGNKAFIIGGNLVTNYANYASWWNGNIQNFRITKGVARYVKSFKLPEEEFPQTRKF